MDENLMALSSEFHRAFIGVHRDVIAFSLHFHRPARAISSDVHRAFIGPALGEGLTFGRFVHFGILTFSGLVVFCDGFRNCRTCQKMQQLLQMGLRLIV